MASAKDRILDSFEDILIKEGERAATMDAVAAAAAVSKGGLLYHFPSKESMVEGLCERLEALTAEDAEKIGAASEGAARYYVRTSLYVDSPLDRAIVAVARLVQQGHPAAAQAFARIQDLWLKALEQALGSRPLAQAIKLMGDGLYYSATFFSGSALSSEVTDGEMEALLEQVDALVARN
ncbi:TetR family transcriptional regulator [Arthrobacter crystallopoietes BAB-32]|uniref:TetR family transcriptional regulator n=1 Tax=Arthrobacter crystallopoietes BAB-32 TaxID=1246476 RepID=N1UXM3_9MICC|nr:TetR family transcriptional regulator [Arthrobacter crystallopoietes]EMY32602.1 TetR family transcriptional regulator [Arthrobacter crystallopoietes BAB-32]